MSKWFAVFPQLKLCLLIAALLCLGKGYYCGKEKERGILSRERPYMDLGQKSTKPIGKDSLLSKIEKVCPNLHNKMASYAKGGNVPDAKTASQVAYAILCVVYGEDVMTKELSLQAHLENEKLWRIEGTLHDPGRSVASILIDRKDAQVLAISHGQ